MPISRDPIIRENGEVQLAAGGRQVAPTFLIIGAHQQTPDSRETSEVQLAAQRRQVAPTFPLIDAQ